MLLNLYTDIMLGNLEQNERQCITNYYAREDVDKEMPRLIDNTVVVFL